MKVVSQQMSSGDLTEQESICFSGNIKEQNQTIDCLWMCKKGLTTDVADMSGPFAPNNPHRYDAELERRRGSLTFDTIHNGEPEI